MKHLISAALVVGILPIVTAASYVSDTQVHPHVHGPDCGHVAEWHVDHMDYLHDGHDHHMHAGVVHEDETISVHVDHPHAHGPNCGHATRVKNNRLEYAHDGDWHHLHGTHYHETHE